MKKFSEILQWISAVAVIILSIFCILILTGLLDFTMIAAPIQSDATCGIVVFSALSVLILCAGGAIAFLCVNRKPKTVRIRKENDGTICYTENAVREMAVFTAKSIENVKQVSAGISVHGEELKAVSIQCILRTGTVLTETVAKMQEEVRNYFQNIAGIPVQEINVVVTKTMD